MATVNITGNTSQTTAPTQKANTGLSAFQSSIQKTTSTLSSTTGTLTGVINNATAGINNAKAALTSTVNNAISAAQTTASSVVGKATSALASALPNAVKSVFGSTDSLLGKVSSVFEDMTKGVKEVDAKIAQLASDVTGALATPVAFITKGLTDVVTGVTTQLSGLMNTSGILSGLGEGLGNLVKVVGSPITSIGELGKAIGSVASSLTQGVAGVVTGITSAAGSIIAPITSTISNFGSSIIGGIGKTLASSGIGSLVSSATGLISATAGLGNAVIDILPSPLNNYVKYKAITSLADAVGLDLKNNSASYIAMKLSGFSDQDILINTVLGLNHTDYKYSIYTDSYGNDISLTLGNGSTSTSDVESLYNGAKSICPDVKLSTKIEFSLQKDFYDVLMTLAAQLGLSDLLAQLFGCSGKSTSSVSSKLTSTLSSSTNFKKLAAYTSSTNSISNGTTTNSINNSPKSLRLLNTTLTTTDTDTTTEDTDPNRINFFDQRTIDILSGLTPTVAYNGDIETFKTIVEILGPSRMQHVESDMVMLNANIKDEGTNMANYHMLLDALDMEAGDLLTDRVVGHHVIVDGPLAAVMSASNTKVVDDVLGQEDRILIQGALSAYAA